MLPDWSREIHVFNSIVWTQKWKSFEILHDICYSSLSGLDYYYTSKWPLNLLNETSSWFSFFLIFQSLIDWDYKEPSSLLQVIEELLQEYRKHQERLVSESQRLMFEYSSLIHDTDIDSEAVEIHVSRTEVYTQCQKNLFSTMRDITLTTLCNEHPRNPQFILKKVGFRRLTSTHNTCLEQNNII